MVSYALISNNTKAWYLVILADISGKLNDLQTIGTEIILPISQSVPVHNHIEATNHWLQW
jgi:hypothetical protein